jgi:hypothetical protein
MENGLSKFAKMNLVMFNFEELSWLKIKFNNSEVFCIGKDNKIRKKIVCVAYLSITNKTSQFRMISSRKPFRTEAWLWQGKLLSYGDCLVLINYVLINILVFML